MEKVHLFWFRRDLRLFDNAGLYECLRIGRPVVPVFIFDRMILEDLSDQNDRRVEFIHEALARMQDMLVEMGSSLEVSYGSPLEVFGALLKKYEVAAVFTNQDYEPYATRRDQEVREFLQSHGVEMYAFKDQVVFDRDEVLKEDGSPYTVFTPYSKRWKSRLNDFYLRSYPVEKYYGHFFKCTPRDLPPLEFFGFKPSGLPFPWTQPSQELIKNYDRTRDFPALDRTSRLSVHLRFGTQSIRRWAREALASNETFLNELIWREFYMSILWHFPHVGLHRSFRPEYDRIVWRNNQEEYERWCRGMTGVPIVDAGMRQLNETGYMHNRLRMIVASYLVKDLLVDWRWGEAYFAEKLLDFDLAANNGGWQWAAGSGCDSVPYFRIFNPELQTRKFDPQFKYITRWVPEYGELSYPRPVVDHGLARERCLKVYKAALSGD